MIIEEIKQIKESKKDLRKFGLTISAALLIIGILLFWFEKPGYIYFLVLGLVLILSALLFPSLLKPLNKIWMTLAIILGWVMTRVILSILFYFVLTPIGLIAKLFGKKFLNLEIDQTLNTYWEKRESKNDRLNYEKQF